MANDSPEPVQTVSTAIRPYGLIALLIVYALAPLYFSIPVISALIINPEFFLLLFITLIPGLLFLYYAYRLWRIPSTRLPFNWKGIDFFLLQFLLLPAIAIILPNMFATIARLNQRRTVNTLKQIGSALEHYRDENHHYPAGNDLNALRSALVPNYLHALSGNDGWKHPLRYEATTNGESYVLSSPGKDGIFEHAHANDGKFCETGWYNSDVAMKDGEFLQVPLGKQYDGGMPGETPPDIWCESKVTK